ncbi:MAG TPA: NAD(P)/FAD-dependent oxidoreductase [Terriglobales bacterium]|nr:NAD(P)/FAD-dependent oxidoreductase [Terriglobales bacterium]
MDSFDAIFVGSGINSLVGAAMLAKSGWKVLVLERSSWLGGAIRTAEITEPGFHHDLYSAWHPLFAGSEAYATLKSDLGARGLEYLNTEYPTAGLSSDGSSAFLSTSQPANQQEFEKLCPGDGDAWGRACVDLMGRIDLAFGILGTELWSVDGLRLGAKAWRRLKTPGTFQFAHELLGSSRQWLERNFRSPNVHTLLVPWILHAGLSPESAGSGFMNKVMAIAFQLGGMPIPKGGGQRLADALVRLIRDCGGTLETDAHVDSVEVGNRRVVGVRSRGNLVRARRAVICSVTPQQLYLKLLSGSVVSEGIQKKAEGFHYGRADMQIHLALSEPPRWPGDDARFLRTAIVHLCDGVNGVSKSVNEADRGLLPADPTIVAGQPMAIDASRAPQGRWILWLQLQELPRTVKGDAAGEIAVGDGQWTESLRERYADRIIRKLSRQIPNLESSIRKRVVLSPADLEAGNINLVGGDPYSGSCEADQFFLLRPLPGLPGHRTPIAGLYHIGASTHPGPGLHGTSGLLVAKELLRRRP